MELSAGRNFQRSGQRDESAVSTAPLPIRELSRTQRRLVTVTGCDGIITHTESRDVTAVTGCDGIITHTESHDVTAGSGCDGIITHTESRDVTASSHTHTESHMT